MARRRQLGSPRSEHASQAADLIEGAKSSLRAMNRKTMTCGGLIQQATHARIRADLAVSEAKHAAGKKQPTALQTAASKVSDQAIRAWQRAMHSCVRESARSKYGRFEYEDYGAKFDGPVQKRRRR